MLPLALVHSVTTLEAISPSAELTPRRMPKLFSMRDGCPGRNDDRQPTTALWAPPGHTGSVRRNREGATDRAGRAARGRRYFDLPVVLLFGVLAPGAVPFGGGVSFVTSLDDDP